MVFISVFSEKRNEIVAVIAYGWENSKFYADWLTDKDPRDIANLKGPILNRMSYQSELSPALLERMKHILTDKDYIERIKKHYWMFKDLIEKESGKGMSKKSTGRVKIGRNSLCPCGSGKKYKNCCMKKKY